MKVSSERMQVGFKGITEHKSVLEDPKVLLVMLLLSIGIALAI